MYIGCFHIRLLCVMAIICLCIPLYVLIVGAGFYVCVLDLCKCLRGKCSDSSLLYVFLFVI